MKHQFLSGCCVLLLWATVAQAVLIKDRVRLKGSETSRLVGMGLVVGLAGTGDGGKYAPGIRALSDLTRRLFDDNTIPAEVAASKNVAVVALEATIPGTGVREGDRIDVHVSAVGSAKSLQGGRLFMVPLAGPLPDSPVYAYAAGHITIEDSEVPTVGVVKLGGQMSRDVFPQLMNSFGQITLVLEDGVASWPAAQNIAGLINGVMAPDGPDIARALNQKNVVIDVPMNERENPGIFINQIMTSYIDQAQINTGARVLVNDRTGQIMLGADVEISPVIISTRGLTITTVTPMRPPTLENPQVKNSNFVAVDPSARGGARLGQLMTALERLQVPAEDRVAIVKNLHKMGKLHAELIIE